jgi:sugar phosphate isomerase/epimerase
VSDQRFGISTHLFHDSRLTRDHLVDIAAHGFDRVEVFATRAHFDYQAPKAAESLAEWLADTGLELHSMHAPIVDAMQDGRWVGSYSTASGNETRRRAAVDHARAALNVARIVPYRFLVVHLGMPIVENVPPGDNQSSATRRSVEELVAAASDVGVRIALEVIPNDLSSPAALVHLLEDDLESIDAGICLDYGHAHLFGDVTEAVETISGHLWTTHVHDNAGVHDEHLVPFAGSIDWQSAIMATQKIGYDGVLMFEVARRGDAAEVLRRTVAARERLEGLFVRF